MEPLLHRWHLCLVRKKGHALVEALPVVEWLKTSTQNMVEKDLARDSLRCCVCWEGPLFNSRIKGHAAQTCPLLASLNRVCSQSRLAPIVVSSLGLAANFLAAPFEPEAEVKNLSKADLELWTEQAALRATFESLRKVSLAEERPSKRRKAAEAPTSNPNNKKKSRWGKSKGKRGGQSGAQPEVGRSKGKQAPPPPSPSPARTPSRVSDWED
jgi:hypothetical protein